MTYFPVQSPYNMFTDTAGEPLESGYIYIGEANQNPITNPLIVSWDYNGLYPAAQPIRTIAGYPDRNGSPGKIFVNTSLNSDYSILIQDKNGQQVFYSAAAIKENIDYGNSVEHLDDLRALTNGTNTVYVRGYDEVGDGGQGEFEWIDGGAPGTYTDNDGTIIVPTGGDGSGAWLRQFDGIADARWFGAHPNNADNYASIQNALDSETHVQVTDGVYIVLDSIVIAASHSLYIGPKTTIYGQAVTNIPVIRVNGNWSYLIGSGSTSIVRTDNLTGGLSSWVNEGVINVGQIDETTAANINWAKVSNLLVRGNETVSNEYWAGSSLALDDYIGIKMVNGDVFDTALSASLYNSVVEHIVFQDVGIGLDLTPVVQGNNFNNLYFYKVSLYGIRIDGCNENSLNQTFFHFSPGCVFVKLKKSDAGLPYYANRPSVANSFTNLIGEPGPNGPVDGRNAKFCEIDVDCNGNYLQGRGNTGHSYTNNANSTIIQGAEIRTEQDSAFNDMDITGDIEQNGTYFQKPAASGGEHASAACYSAFYSGWPQFGAGDHKRILQINVPVAQVSLLVKLTATYGYLAASTTSWNAQDVWISIDRGNTANVRAKIKRFSLPYGGSGISNVEVSGADVFISFYSNSANVQPIIILEAYGGNYNDTYTRNFVVTQLPGTTNSTVTTWTTGGEYFNQDILPMEDDTFDLGSGTYRYNTVYATVGAINTSDATMKKDIQPLSDIEKIIALELKTLVRKFKFKNHDNNKIHIGIIAQDIEKVFLKYGLNPMDYGLIDKTGGRYGVNYNQILAFIISSI